MLYVVVECCWELLCKVWKQLNFWAHNSQHFFCSIRDCQAQLQHCCSSNIVRANHTHYTWSPKSHMYGLYPSHNSATCTAGPNIVGSKCCICLHTTAKTDTTNPTLSEAKCMRGVSDLDHSLNKIVQILVIVHKKVINGIEPELRGA